MTDVPISDLAAENNGPTMLGEPTVLTATIVRGTNVAYAWVFGDGEVGAGSVVEHRYPAVGIYTATVTASNGVGAQVARTEVIAEGRPIFVIYLPLLIQRESIILNNGFIIENNEAISANIHSNHNPIGSTFDRVGSNQHGVGTKKDESRTIII